MLFAADVVGRLLGKCASVPRIISSLRARNVHYSLVQRWLTRITIDAADAVVINSPHSREFAIVTEGVKPDRIFLIPNGVQVGKYMTGGALAVVSLAMVGQQGVFDLAAILKSMGNYTFVVRPALMPNVRGLSNALALGGNFEATLTTAVISLALYALCLYIWRGKFDVGSSGFDLKFSLTLVTTVLISYHLYAHA